MGYKDKYYKYKNKYIENKFGGKKIRGLAIRPKQNYDENRILGSLYGVCVGDALGARYEFLEKFEAIDQINKDLVNSKLPMLGGGPFQTIAGQITDDSEMMLCLLRSLSELGYYNQADVAQKYIEWYNSSPIDIGKTISRALFTRKPAKNVSDMIENAKSFNANSLSNGVLMRVAPLGIIGLNLSGSNLKKIVTEESDLTHPNFIIKDAAFIICCAIKYAIKGNNKQQIYDKLLKRAATARVKIILRDAMISPEPTFVIEDMNELYADTDDRKFQGYFGMALQNTIYELMLGKEYALSMINIIKRGGDTDTNCAIAGGVLGAFYGLQGITPEWLNAVKNVKVERFVTYPSYAPSMIDKYVNKLFYQ